MQEVYEDLRKHIGIIRYIPKADRENLIKVLLGLYDICKITSASSGRHSDCVSILSLSDSDTRPKSRASDREIEDAAKMVRDSNLMTRSDRMDVIREAMSRGERGVSGNLEKVLFLRAVGKGKDREFFGDVWLKLLYADDPRQFTGRCGRVICTQEYIDHIEQHIFGRNIPNYYGGRSGDRAYGRLMTSSLENIAKAIEGDLEQGIRDNDYIQDKNADNLKEAPKELERCGVRCYSLERKVDDLAWFVGGDPDKIRKLQQKLNEPGLGERLKEDGVSGKKTDSAVKYFFNRLQQGSFPTIVYLDPLQSKSTQIYSRPIPTANGMISSLHDLSARSRNKKGDITVFRADIPDDAHPFYHINTVEGRSIKDGKYVPTSRQLAHLNKWNHTQISDDAYRLLRNFDGVAKKVRIGGTVLLVASEALDIIELCKTIEPQLQGANKKLDKETWSSIASMGGSWILGAVGSKAGAWTGAAIGTAIMPGVGTAIGGVAGGIILGTFGSVGGDRLGRKIVDITVLEE